MKIVDKNGKAYWVDLGDIGEVSKYEWTVGRRGYVYASIEGKLISLHRHIMRAPKGVEVDHINHNKSDCRRSNLRICTHAQNTHNCERQVNNTSGYKGVSYHKRIGKWQARIKYNLKEYCLGYFNTPELAAKAYWNAAQKYHGEFACSG